MASYAHEFRGHDIKIKNEISKMSLIIDGETQDCRTGAYPSKTFTLQGQILNGRDQGDEIKVEFKRGFLFSSLIFYYNDKQIGKSTVLI
ncbi:hypothetical protein ACFPES_03150 [Paenibacillus sp. GCM10023248]|uniref:hypothetical protein n=1 Tax=unclassified Paenibacillus TaxID=185978 RepID=UPI002379E73E|nr:hypothetical protein [Paenibacillus sp. MAHUQ-63]MDD9266022.1 hypothetical protein [Paenibacillus sp. MAHUQ-63]